MARRTLTDGSGRWFDDAATVVFHEKTRWNGRNDISCATGSQWNHERLHYTRSGRWILNAWSQWQGSTATYTEIGVEEAIRWLSDQECWEENEINELPADLRKRVKAGFADAEM